jgi:hypothetical protein
MPWFSLLMIGLRERQAALRLHGGNVGDIFLSVNKKYHLHKKYNLIDCI